MAAAKTPSDKRPSTCDGRSRSNGKKNPVTLVATVLARKTAVQPSSRRAVSSPHRTTNPERIPSRLTATCPKVKVFMPSIMICPSTFLIAVASVREYRSPRRIFQQFDGTGRAEKIVDCQGPAAVLSPLQAAHFLVPGLCLGTGMWKYQYSRGEEFST